MQKHADWFDDNEPAQSRFEENEEWLEELEDRIAKLEQVAHKPRKFVNCETCNNKIKEN